MARTRKKAPARSRPEKPLTPQLAAMGARLRTLRKARGLRGQDMGIHPTSYSFKERGLAAITYMDLVLFAARLGMSVPGLVTLPRTPKS